MISRIRPVTRDKNVIAETEAAAFSMFMVS